MAVDAAEGKLARAGLLVLNPPFGFDSDMTGNSGRDRAALAGAARAALEMAGWKALGSAA